MNGAALADFQMMLKILKCCCCCFKHLKAHELCTIMVTSNISSKLLSVSPYAYAHVHCTLFFPSVDHFPVRLSKNTYTAKYRWWSEYNADKQTDEATARLQNRISDKYYLHVCRFKVNRKRTKSFGIRKQTCESEREQFCLWNLPKNYKWIKCLPIRQHLHLSMSMWIYTQRIEMPYKIRFHQVNQHLWRTFAQMAYSKLWSENPIQTYR